ncbi:MAG: adenine phosphoribosyltransferase [Candidatus Glassbacteria bacterium RBG_16_58_8]|uniref:Adenine phosphoribosyltransferase n=1 Tax=Candidatus Glassbacteria bacterium RBG_16_58_8 TaxID=1817866 RepID=A0A1F5YD92_9BACT|nr:MAG: adenine phosphoribosyltransferase [Candidatus Glassbacteria bacterium RBG_16_58_8]
MEKLRRAVRDIPDFPKKGIVFKDITPVLQDRDLFRSAIDIFAGRYRGKGIEKVVGIESRGFLFASALAYQIGAGLIPVRKPGKLPYQTERASYQLEYGQDAVEIHRDAISAGESVLAVDDLLATGGTMAATLGLVERLGGKVYEVAFLIELGFLNGRDRLRDREIFSVLKF